MSFYWQLSGWIPVAGWDSETWMFWLHHSCQKQNTVDRWNVGAVVYFNCTVCFNLPNRDVSPNSPEVEAIILCYKRSFCACSAHICHRFGNMEDVAKIKIISLVSLLPSGCYLVIFEALLLPEECHLADTGCRDFQNEVDRHKLFIKSLQKCSAIRETTSNSTHFHDKLMTPVYKYGFSVIPRNIKLFTCSTSAPLGKV